MKDQEPEFPNGDRRFLDRIRNAQNRGTGGVISWTREQLYESSCTIEFVEEGLGSRAEMTWVRFIDL